MADQMSRRKAIGVLAVGTGAAMAVAGCSDGQRKPKGERVSQGNDHEEVILGVERLGQQWRTPDPFLFCVHHDDAYPAGNEEFGPVVPLTGRQLGQDFSGKDGWRDRKSVV